MTNLGRCQCIRQNGFRIYDNASYTTTSFPHFVSYHSYLHPCSSPADRDIEAAMAQLSQNEARHVRSASQEHERQARLFSRNACLRSATDPRFSDASEMVSSPYQIGKFAITSAEFKKQCPCTSAFSSILRCRNVPWCDLRSNRGPQQDGEPLRQLRDRLVEQMAFQSRDLNDVEKKSTAISIVDLSFCQKSTLR